jgi:hypothetical protein
MLENATYPLINIISASKIHDVGHMWFYTRFDKCFVKSLNKYKKGYYCCKMLENMLVVGNTFYYFEIMGLTLIGYIYIYIYKLSLSRTNVDLEYMNYTMHRIVKCSINRF